jgi:ATP-dependent DNA helicase RecG
VISPGGAFGAVAADNFGQPGLTDYRNPNLADAMKTLGYVQRFGVGIGIARRHLEQAGHPPPEFDVSSSFVRATIFVARSQEATIG